MCSVTNRWRNEGGVDALQVTNVTIVAHSSGHNTAESPGHGQKARDPKWVTGGGTAARVADSPPVVVAIYILTKRLPEWG